MAAEFEAGIDRSDHMIFTRLVLITEMDPEPTFDAFQPPDEIEIGALG